MGIYSNIIEFRCIFKESLYKKFPYIYNNSHKIKFLKNFAMWTASTTIKTEMTFVISVFILSDKDKNPAEKLLLFGGAINAAGAVKARGENRRAHSDWMKVEQERGISVASSVMTFESNPALSVAAHPTFVESVRS